MGKSSLSKPPMVLATPFSPCRAMVLQGHGAALKYNLGGKCWIYPRKSLPKGWFSDVWSNSPILCLRSMHLYNSRYTWMLVTMHPRSSSWSLFHGCELRTNRYWANGNSDCKWWFCLANEPEIRSGWWYTYPSEKYEFVSWDDEIPNIWKNKFYVPNHQPEIIKVSFTFSVTKCCYTKEIHAKVATASRQCRTASQFHAMIKLRSTGYVPTRNSPMSRLTPSWPVPSSFMGTSATFRWCHFLGHSEQWIRPSRFRAANWPQPNALWFLWGLGHPCLYSFNTVHIKGWAKATKIVSPVCHPQLRRWLGDRAQGPTKVQRVPCPRDEVVKPGLVTPLLAPKNGGHKEL